MKIIDQIKVFILSLFGKISTTTRQLSPVIIAILNGLKKFDDSPFESFVLNVIKSVVKNPGLVDKIHGEINHWLPEVLRTMATVQEVSNLKTPEEQLAAILKRLNLGEDWQKKAFYTTLSALIYEALSDGKLKYSEAIHILQYDYSTAKE